MARLVDDVRCASCGAGNDAGTAWCARCGHRLFRWLGDPFGNIELRRAEPAAPPPADRASAAIQPAHRSAQPEPADAGLAQPGGTGPGGSRTGESHRATGERG